MEAEPNLQTRQGLDEFLSSIENKWNVDERNMVNDVLEGYKRARLNAGVIQEPVVSEAALTTSSTLAADERSAFAEITRYFGEPTIDAVSRTEEIEAVAAGQTAQAQANLLVGAGGRRSRLGHERGGTLGGFLVGASAVVVLGLSALAFVQARGDSEAAPETTVLSTDSAPSTTSRSTTTPASVETTSTTISVADALKIRTDSDIEKMTAAQLEAAYGNKIPTNISKNEIGEAIIHKDAKETKASINEQIRHNPQALAFFDACTDKGNVTFEDCVDQSTPNGRAVLLKADENLKAIPNMTLEQKAKMAENVIAHLEGLRDLDIKFSTHSGPYKTVALKLDAKGNPIGFEEITNSRNNDPWVTFTYTGADGKKHSATIRGCMQLVKAIEQHATTTTTAKKPTSTTTAAPTTSTTRAATTSTTAASTTSTTAASTTSTTAGTTTSSTAPSTTSTTAASTTTTAPSTTTTQATTSTTRPTTTSSSIESTTTTSEHETTTTRPTTTTAKPTTTSTTKQTTTTTAPASSTTSTTRPTTTSTSRPTTTTTAKPTTTTTSQPTTTTRPTTTVTEKYDDGSLPGHYGDHGTPGSLETAPAPTTSTTIRRMVSTVLSTIFGNGSSTTGGNTTTTPSTTPDSSQPRGTLRSVPLTTVPSAGSTMPTAPR